ncbi:hypothetical protein [Sphingobacterium multivorum]|uniref:Uncharacterized protein n=1 Tax=Sphingobacterium multivorum TaxID=28454 RepID=A0A654D161_SPHMU|nr:hypothetical protein [Sphingobacterium multivorum]VXC99527.1 conserved hypothetical protein [Sphingobacterium multivorum]
MIKRKTSECVGCGKVRQIYAKHLCPYCYEKQRKKTPLPKPTKPIPKLSKTRKKELPIYSKKAKEHKEKYPYCQAKLEGCTHFTEETHHMKGRGKYYLDESTFLSLCKNCHDIITEHSAFAIREGFSISRLKKEP